MPAVYEFFYDRLLTPVMRIIPYLPCQGVSEGSFFLALAGTLRYISRHRNPSALLIPISPFL